MKVNNTIQNKLVSMIVLIVSIVTLLGYLIFSSWYIKEQKEQNLQLANTVSHVISQDLAKLILLNNVSSASDLSTKLDSFKFLNWLVVYKMDKTPIYKYSHKHIDFNYPVYDAIKVTINDNEIIYTLKANYMGNDLGYMKLSMKYVSIYELVKQNILWMLIVYLMMIIFSYILSIFYAKKFTKPILKLVEFMKNINMQNISKDRVALNEDNEFAILEYKINSMLDNLNKSLQQQRIASVAFETHSGMIITNEKFEILQINQAYTKITGFSIDDVKGKIPPVFTVNEDIVNEIKDTLKSSHYWSGEIENYTKRGEKFLEYLTIQEVCDDDCIVTNYVFSFVDISKQKEAEKTIAYLSKYDFVTGLANKKQILENLSKLKNNIFNTEDKWYIFIEFDIKDFKYINEAYGYSVGDKLLQEIASRLSQLKNHNILGKIGVDEFIVGFESGFYDEESATMYAQLITEHLLELMTQRYIIDNKDIEISINIGVYIYDVTMQTPEEILQNTNLALNNAKQNNKYVAYFNEDIEKQVKSYMNLYLDMKKAIQKDEFVLCYQPQYNTKSKIVSAEVLLRWQHPTLGLIQPNEFIYIAEKSGLIIDIGWWIVQKVCIDIARWQTLKNGINIPISINISAKQFTQDDFVDKLYEILTNNNISANQIKLELVESLLLENVDSVIYKMKQLQELGFKLSLDDFGTGYSSLEYLKLLPIKEIKIDKSFVKSMRENDKDLAIVKSVLSLGEAFEYDVIAEGVETKEDFMLLKALNCEYYQGYYFSKPLSKDRFEKLFD
jgi:diguanylate cyclase (GGDEF)-like protein/PAS domain S-box-containing protein